MRRLVLWTATTLLTGSLWISGPYAQHADDDFFPPGNDGPTSDDGPVGSVDDLPSDDDQEDWWPAVVPHSPYEGPLGQVDNREPHDACENCFVIPDIFDYDIFESVPIDDGDSEYVITRMIPNPAPLEEGEVRPMVDADGEPLWYIGTQSYSGPKDTDRVSDQVEWSMIDLLRIKARHENRIMTTAGVHGFGIVATGFGIWVLPEYAEIMVPDQIEGVPVTVFVEPMLERQGHQHTTFRPVPVGAAIEAAQPGLAMLSAGGGTLGFHMVQEVGQRYRLLSLTAAHVVRVDPTAAPPTAGTIDVYQPRIQFGNLFGQVYLLFRLRTCGMSRTACWKSSAPMNHSRINPDIALIDPLPYGGLVSLGFNRPRGTDPTRHLQYGSGSREYTNGPSGSIRNAYPGHKLKIWGAFSGPRSGSVTATGRTVVSRFRGRYYKDCCLTAMNVGVSSGDSGAAVTFDRRGSRHVVGILAVGSSTEAWFMTEVDIKQAFDASNVPFSHFWGTRGTGYRPPSTTACDNDDCSDD